MDPPLNSKVPHISKIAQESPIVRIRHAAAGGARTKGPAGKGVLRGSCEHEQQVSMDSRGLHTACEQPNHRCMMKIVLGWNAISCTTLQPDGPAHARCAFTDPQPLGFSTKALPLGCRDRLRPVRDGARKGVRGNRVPPGNNYRSSLPREWVPSIKEDFPWEHGPGTAVSSHGCC